MKKTVSLLFLFGSCLPAFALSLEDYPQAAAFIDNMSRQHGIDPAQLTTILSEAEIKGNILAAMERPAEAKPWYQYRTIFLTERRIGKGAQFLRKYQALLDQAELTYGVPPHIITAILGVETFYGTRTGSFRVLDALSTLAFAYPKRSRFFSKELEHFFLLSRQEQIDPRQPRGSYAGAMGWPQFMPSSYRHYAADFDRDGKRDIWDNPADVIASVANYLARHGWQRGQPVATRLPDTFSSLANRDLQAKFSLSSLKDRGLKLAGDYPPTLKGNVLQLEGKSDPEYWLAFTNFYVITRYNHSPLYAMAVHQLGEAIRNRLQDGRNP